MIKVILPDYLFIANRWDFVNQKELIRREKNRGIYVLFDEFDNVLYVGKSRRLISRVRSHMRGHGSSEEFASFIYKIGVIPVKRLCDLDIYETYAINTLKPRYNRDKVFMTDEDLRLLEFKLTMAVGKVEQLRDEIYCLQEEDYCNLRDIDIENAKEALAKERSECRKLANILDDYGR